MTLGRQLLAGITVAFVALLLGIEAIYVSNAKNALEQQLDAHANETATSLALSLGVRMSTLDASLVKITVNPVFDRGHFESIEVITPTGERVYLRELARRELDVPHWFVALVPLQGPKGAALVTSGWRQLGKVMVRVSPEYAYRQLFDTARATLAWLAVLFALALAAMRRYLAGILSPLHQIEQAALAISNRDFVSIDTEPRSRELQSVTQAMNSLSAKIRDAITQESEHAERLRKDALGDSLTGQLNRRGFEQWVRSAMGEGGEIHSGALVLFSLTGLDEVNRVFGMKRGDEILKELADALRAPSSQATPIVGRWQGPTLAAFLPNAGADAALAWVDGIGKAFAARLRAAGLPEGVVVACGGAHFSAAAVSLNQLSQAAEGAFAQAVKRGDIVLVPSQSGAPPADLKQEVEAAIAADRIVLLGQKVVSLVDAQVVQLEVFSSLTGGDGKPIAAAAFVPVANQHGLLPLLDRKVIEHAIDAIGRIASLPAVISANVSMQSIADAGFRAALRELLTKESQAARRLVFEMTGYAASRSPDIAKAFAAELRELGAQIALDNFDLDRNAMAIVHELRPAYIKLAPAFTQQIGAREDLRFIVEAMLRMLRPLEIPLIAQGVEDPEAIAILAELGLSAYQGYAGGKPEALSL
jgi:diguanylate cyclase (GGDEF)-like protein